MRNYTSPNSVNAANSSTKWARDMADCRNQYPAVNPWHSLLASRERLLKDRGRIGSRFYNRETDLNSIRRGSVRWGKRFDSKEWRMAFKELLRPTNIAMSRNWTPIISEVLPKESAELEVRAFRCNC
ncbi:hypothetical protein COOONC_00282, partial [Cooperia oncophora]